MSRFVKSLMLLAFAVVSAPAFAQDAVAGSGTSGMVYLAAGIAMAGAVLGAASGQGRAAASAYEAIGRNPQAADKIMTPLIIGLALIEFQTILAFVIAILLVNK